MAIIFEATIIQRKYEVFRNILRAISGGASAYFIVNGVNWCFDKAPFKPEWKIYALLLAIVPMALAIIIRITSNGKLMVQQLAGGQLEISVEEKTGSEIRARGQWTCTAQYRKVHVKYGLYAKQMFLKLYCNGKVFCVLRHDRKPLEKPPPGFDLVDEVFLSGSPIYICKKTYAVFELVQKTDRQVT